LVRARRSPGGKLYLVRRKYKNRENFRKVRDRWKRGGKKKKDIEGEGESHGTIHGKLIESRKRRERRGGEFFERIRLGYFNAGSEGGRRA